VYHAGIIAVEKKCITSHSNWYCLTLSFADDLDAFKKEWSRLRQTPQYPAKDNQTKPKPDHLSILDQFFK
jgi:hypothetical protein